MCVCVLECALRAKLIFLFIKKKSKYICIFVCCAATPSHTLPPRALNIIFVSAAKNIIYVLFMIFRFPLAFNFLLFASFDGFLVRVFIETCLIYTQRHLGTHSEKADADSAMRTHRENRTRTRPARIHVCTIAFTILYDCDSHSDSNTDSDSDSASHHVHHLLCCAAQLACCIYRLLFGFFFLFSRFIYT